MKRSKFTEEQIIGILREQEAGAKTAEVCRRHGISGATFYAWKAKFGGMEPSEAKRLKALDRAMVRHWSKDNGEGERQAEAPARRGDARQHRPEGSALKKCMVRPAFARLSCVAVRLA